MKKILGIILLLGCELAYAQFSPGFLKSNNQQLIEDAVSGGIFLMKQEYQLEDTLTNKRYSLDDRPEFGSAVSIAVKTREGYIFANDLITPWEKDSNYDKYRNTKYRPVLTRRYEFGIRDSVWREASYSGADTLVYVSDSCLVEEILHDSMCGFQRETSTGEKNGWVVWLLSSETDMNQPKLSMSLYRHKLSIEKGQQKMEIIPANMSGTMLGGIYVNPDFSEVGCVRFLLNGVIVKSGDKWELNLISSEIPKVVEKDEEVSSEPELTPVDAEVDDEQPIKKKKKLFGQNKKQENDEEN